MKYDNFTQMPVWQKAFQLMLKIYQITKKFPSDERFGLISDMRRSANSIVHNIALDLVASIPKKKVNSIVYPEAVHMNCGVRFYIGKTRVYYLPSTGPISCGRCSGIELP